MESSRQNGWQQGLEQGRNEGKSEGEARMGQLISYLMRDGNTDLIPQVIADINVRNKYYAKYGI